MHTLVDQIELLNVAGGMFFLHAVQSDTFGSLPTAKRGGVASWIGTGGVYPALPR